MLAARSRPTNLVMSTCCYNYSIASRVAVEGWNKVCGRPGCNKDSCAMKCSKCRVIYYCGRECQTKDWKAHKRVCAQMAMGKVKPSES